MANVHPTAVVDPEVELGEGVEIGPQCVVEGRVRLGDGVRLLGRSYLRGPLTIGAGTIVYPFVSLGFPAQDVKFAIGDPTAGVVVGERCILRESVTIHAATNTEKPTRVGNDVFMMVGAHVGHDASVGNRCVMVNGSMMAGHSELHDGATMSGLTAIHQYGRVGRLAFLSGGVVAPSDVPPFCICAARSRVEGVNVVGMRRAGMARDEITAVRGAFREVFHARMAQTQMVERLTELGERSPAVLEMREFIATSSRPIAAGIGSPPRGFAGWVRALQRGELIEAVEVEPEDL